MKHTRSIEIINEEMHHKRFQIDFNNRLAIIEPELEWHYKKCNNDLEFDINELKIFLLAVKEKLDA